MKILKSNQNLEECIDVLKTKYANESPMTKTIFNKAVKKPTVKKSTVKKPIAKKQTTNKPLPIKKDRRFKTEKATNRITILLTDVELIKLDKLAANNSITNFIKSKIFK